MAQIKIPFGKRQVKKAGASRSSRPTPGDTKGESKGESKGETEAGGPTAMGVTELVTAAHTTLERSFGHVWVEGEVSNLHLAGSGHAYFTLRDDRSALPTAMWRSSVQRLRFRLEEGAQIRVHGRLGIYGAQGKFQFYADRAEPAGRGDLLLAFERLKEKLAAEGLFDPERKRPLPRWPRTIGVVTSARGAAVHDIIEVTQRRCPSHMLISPALVQGDTAPRDLIRALELVSTQPDVDLVIIGRGGGSTEDLWAFNDEALARAVAASPVPVISAVGHEVDVTVCDMVADLRAATPSQAGELAVLDLGDVRSHLRSLGLRLEGATERRLLDRRGHLDALTRRLERQGRAELGRQRRRLDHARRALEKLGRGLVEEERERLERLSARLERQHPRARLRRDTARLEALRARLATAGRAQISGTRLRLAGGAAKLDALSPLSVLGRGFALVTKGDGELVRSSRQLSPGDQLSVRLKDGVAETTVQEVQTVRADDASALADAGSSPATTKDS